MNSFTRGVVIGRYTQILFLLFLLIIVSVESAAAQTKVVNREHQQWLQYNSQAKVSDKWSLLLAAGYRWKEGFHEPTSYIFRTAAYYQLRKNIQLSGGFGVNGAYALGKVNRIEYRPYEDLAIKSDLGKIGLIHRYRIEQRFFQYIQSSKVTPDHNFVLRLRYALNITVPLFTIGEEASGKKVFLNAGDEIFLNAGKKVIYNLFDQNRIMIGPAFQIHKGLIFSFTWNSQYGTTPTPGIFRYSDAFWLQVRHQIDLRKGGNPEVPDVAT